MCADDILLESLILAEKWRIQDAAKRLLQQNKVKIWENPFNSALASFTLYGNNMLIFDGGAMSEDGRIVVVFPKVQTILDNNSLIDDFLLSVGVARNDIDLVLELPPTSIVTPFEIFFCCITKNFKTEDFRVLVNKTGLLL